FYATHIITHWQLIDDYIVDRVCEYFHHLKADDGWLFRGRHARIAYLSEDDSIATDTDENRSRRDPRGFEALAKVPAQGSCLSYIGALLFFPGGGLLDAQFAPAGRRGDDP